MDKLNLAATEIMEASSFTRSQARQMLLQLQSENKCSIETACHAVMMELGRIKRAGVKGRVNGEKSRDKVIECCAFCEYFDGEGEIKVKSIRDTLPQSVEGDCLNPNSESFQVRSNEVRQCFIRNSTF